MNRFHLALSLVLGCCFLLSKPLVADDALSPFAMSKQFSADQVTTTQDMTITSKIFVDSGKIRTEMTTANMQVISIVRPDLKTVYSVMPAQKMVMEMPFDPSKVGQLTPASAPDSKFEVVGSETVEGIACTKYKITAKDGKVSFMWVDAAKKIPVKMAADDNSYSLLWKNYKIGPQAASLFDVPTGYQVMKMPAMAMPAAAPHASAAAATTSATPDSSAPTTAPSGASSGSGQ